MTNNQLTSSQLQELERLLQARRTELQAQISDDQADLAPSQNTAGSVSQDENARLANQTREVESALSAIDWQELARIDRALDALAAGDYGFCHECGDAIAFERLKIEPMTQRCVACKSRWEEGNARA